MDKPNTIAVMKDIIERGLLAGDYPGLPEITGTSTARNGDILVHFVAVGRESLTIRISLTAER